MGLQMEDIDLYAKHQYAMRAGSFHASDDGTRVFNHAHWASPTGPKDWRASDDMKAHLDRMKVFDFEVDPHPYQVASIPSRNASPEIKAENGWPASPAMIYCASTDQEALASTLNDYLARWDTNQPPGHVASWLAASRDGERIAIYTQWNSVDDFGAYQVSAENEEVTSLIGASNSDHELKLFRVGSVGHKG